MEKHYLTHNVPLLCVHANIDNPHLFQMLTNAAYKDARLMQSVAILMVATIVTVALVTRIILQVDLKPLIASVSGFVCLKRRGPLFYVIMESPNSTEY